MKRKEKTVEKVIRSDTAEDGENSYRYTLIMRESARVASYKLPLYSIAIEMTRGDETVSYAETNEMFADVGKALAFYNKMVKFLATPIDLPYIVEDEMAR